MRSAFACWRVVQLEELLASRPQRGTSGSVVFLAGEAGSGRSDLLRDAATRFRQLERPPTVLAGGFVHGAYVPWGAPRRPAPRR